MWLRIESIERRPCGREGGFGRRVGTSKASTIGGGGRLPWPGGGVTDWDRVGICLPAVPRGSLEMGEFGVGNNNACRPAAFGDGARVEEDGKVKQGLLVWSLVNNEELANFLRLKRRQKKKKCRHEIFIKLKNLSAFWIPFYHRKKGRSEYQHSTNRHSIFVAPQAEKATKNISGINFCCSHVCTNPRPTTSIAVVVGSCALRDGLGCHRLQTFIRQARRHGDLQERK